MSSKQSWPTPPGIHKASAYLRSRTLTHKSRNLNWATVLKRYMEQPAPTMSAFSRRVLLENRQTSKRLHKVHKVGDVDFMISMRKLTDAQQREMTMIYRKHFRLAGWMLIDNVVHGVAPVNLQDAAQRYRLKQEYNRAMDVRIDQYLLDSLAAEIKDIAR